MLTRHDSIKGSKSNRGLIHGWRTCDTNPASTLIGAIGYTND